MTFFSSVEQDVFLSTYAFLGKKISTYICIYITKMYLNIHFTPVSSSS